MHEVLLNNNMGTVYHFTNFKPIDEELVREGALFKAMQSGDKRKIKSIVYGNFSLYGTEIHAGGWAFDLFPLFHTYLVCQYGQWTEYKAINKKHLKRLLCTSSFKCNGIARVLETD